jgi:Tol biopolymer transport system component
MRTLLAIAALAALLVCVLPAVAASRAAASGRIAYVRGGDVWTISPDGSGARRLTGGSREDLSPAWSPDRRTIAFVRAPKEWGDTPAICTVSPEGGSSHAVHFRDGLAPTAFHFINCLAWSPDGNKLAFSDMYQLSGGGTQPEWNRLVVIDVRTRRATVLIKHKEGFDGALDAGWPISWSPDGKSLLIGQWGLDSEGGETHVFTIAGRHLRKLPVPDATWPDWAPDAGTIVLSTATQERTSILLARPDGTVIRTLLRGLGWQGTVGSPSYKDACFSTDGRQIAYTADPSPGDEGRAVWVMDADGGGRHRLVAGSYPAWR